MVVTDHMTRKRVHSDSQRAAGVLAVRIGEITDGHS